MRSIAVNFDTPLSSGFITGLIENVEQPLVPLVPDEDRLLVRDLTKQTDETFTALVRMVNENTGVVWLEWESASV